MALSPLHVSRLAFTPTLPIALSGSIRMYTVSLGKKTTAIANTTELKKIFTNTFGQPVASIKKGKKSIPHKPYRVGVILSGGPAAGGHNVIAGIFDALKKMHASSELIGFLRGPIGLVDNKKIPLTKTLISNYRNTGGFDIIGSGRTKIESPEQFKKALINAEKNKLNAIVVIGGDDSNTNAALLAEYFISHKSSVQVIGIPKTIDGDLKNEYIETSFGFDTAIKTYSELIGNIERDANSAKKYWHFIRLMGRSASHITLECALQTQPNIALISEEVQYKKQSLTDIIKDIANVIELRAKNNENFGAVLVPEGLIEFIPEMNVLISKLNDILAQSNAKDKFSIVKKSLPNNLKKIFASLPHNIQTQLLLDRDAHGNVQVSLIETERMLIQMVSKELEQRKKAKTYTGTFVAQSHFFGYEARCAFPSNFDAQYCYTLGYNAIILIANGLTGYISSVGNLSAPTKKWKVGGVPLTMMMNIEKRHGNNKPVIKKALVDLKGRPFKTFINNRKKWASKTMFRYPGAIQYFGKNAADATITIVLEKNK